MNLADTKGRDIRQQDQIGRRPSIIPEARNTRAPALEVNATMRNARRGDGGADEILRSLGMLERSLGEAQGVAQEAYAQREADNIAKGAADQATGHVDPEMEEKSEGYRNAVTKGRTMNEFNAATREFDEELRGVIERQDDPVLEHRQADVRARLEQFYTNFTLDPETKQPRASMQSPTAMRYLAGAITASRTEMQGLALRRIEERFTAEAVGHFGQNFTDQALATGAIDLSLALSTLPRTVPFEVTRDTAVIAFGAAAAKLTDAGRGVEGLKVLDAVLGKPKPASLAPAGHDQPFPEDVDPVTLYERGADIPQMAGLERLRLAPEHMLRLRQTRDALADRIRSKWREGVDKTQEFNSSGMALRLYGQGTVLTRTEINGAIESGAVSPRQGLQLYGMMQSQADAQRAASDRRMALEDRDAAKAREDRISAISGRYIGAILSGRMTGSQARAQLLSELPRIRDPKVASAVANAVLGTSADIETLNLNSKPVRDAIRRVSDGRDYWVSRAGRWASAVTPRIESLLDQASTEIATRVRDGEKVEDAERAALARFKPKLEALTAGPPRR